MSTLSLNLDDRSMARARALAAAQNMSIEEMLARLIERLTEPIDVSKLPPNTRAATGLLKGLPENRDYKELLAEALIDDFEKRQ